MAVRRLWFMILLGCAAQRVDPHAPNDRCLYTCPDGMTCAGTTFTKGRSNPGQCQLVVNRCMTSDDCHPRESCLRAGDAVGVCKPQNLL